MPSAEIWLDGYHGLMQKPFQSLISLQSSSFTCSLFSKKGLPKVFMRLWIKVWCSAECILKRKGVAKIDWSALLMIGSIECIIYWASNKSVHKQSTQQRFLFLGAFNVDGSPFLLFIINHNALTVLLEPASVLTALRCWVPFPRNPGTDKVGGSTCSLSICAAAFIPHPCKLFIKETIT